MAREWTSEQKQVIWLRGTNLLVSAAAGSGKTAVLVERILSVITDENDPVDIDRLLVVTFTNAAAGEMKERIQSALQERLAKEPENGRLQRQISLLPHARITTIHSFCLDVVRNHFQEADIDPSFRIGDEGEMKLLQEDILSELLEAEYEAKDPAFLHFAAVFAPERDDALMEKLISTLYTYSTGYPWSGEWRSQCLHMYRPGSPREMEEQTWMQCAHTRTVEKLEDLRSEIRSAMDLCARPRGPELYLDALRSDEELLEKLLEADGYERLHLLLTQHLTFETLSRKKNNGEDEQLRAAVKTMRDNVKKELQALREQYKRSREELHALLVRSSADLEELIVLTDRFEKAYTKEKRERNLVDFSDLEHLALQILIDRKDGNMQMSPAALSYAAHFREVMVDEYQDSNLLQELILNAVSGNLAGAQKRFMVGDVKQSIYRFRQARPEIFTEKYDRFSREEGEGVKIDLNRNFRSRVQILDFVNRIFSRIMARELGGVAYDENAAMIPGTEAAGEREAFCVPEIMLIPEKPDTAPGEAEEKAKEDTIFSDNRNDKEQGDEQNQEQDQEQEEEDKLTREARAVARRIRQLVASEQIRDEENGGKRPVRYGDIAVLLRSLSSCAQTFGRVFDEEAIPCYTGSGTGYFSAPEVRTMLNYLTLVDNPLQDIPLAAILRSSIGRLTDEDLARVRAKMPDMRLYTAICDYAGQRQDETAGKIRSFLEVFHRIRGLSSRLTIHELLWEIRSQTGYGAWVLTLPSAPRRKANLDMLSEKAEAFEAGSYQGLFQFIRYIEQLYKYEVDFGEAPTESGERG
ncbi:MAG: helicase-exonuclease AddAB subunit AddA, partial [Lachnospiraceae bacterium]|nr:helicase-exonuclease AddAB subunit AddA [Lachnospiraceae bacterium]